jgi:cytoskeleton protein RodZ
MTTPPMPRDPEAGMIDDADQLSLQLGEEASREAAEHAARTEASGSIPVEDGDEAAAIEVDEASGQLFEPIAIVPVAGPPTSLGTRLRLAREARELGLEQVSRALRIPVARLADLERDEYDAIGAPVYLRGYLRSYARHVGLPEVVVQSALEHAAPPPPLVATRSVSRSHYVTSRYGTLLVYGVLTAVFVVPLLWAARQGSLLPERRPALATLDTGSAELPAPPPGTVAPPSGAPAASSPNPEPVGPPEAAVAEPPRPVMATMAPMPSTAEIEPANDAASRTVTLSLAQASWIELVAADGTRLEYALLPAGSRREYTVAGAANLRIGNTRGATLEIDGEPVELAAHTRANVARVAIPAPVAR